MKKVLMALLFLASTLGFAQDGRTKIEYINQTSVTLYFYDNGQSVSSVIPNGFYEESVLPGAHILYAVGSNGSISRSIDLEDGHTFQWTVAEESSKNLSPYTKLVLASYTQYDGFSVNAPIPLTTDGPTQSTLGDHCE